MKKLIYIAIFLLGFTSYVNANGINIGVSITGGVFDATGSEVFSGDHASNASSTKVTKKGFRQLKPYRNCGTVMSPTSSPAQFSSFGSKKFLTRPSVG